MIERHVGTNAGVDVVTELIFTEIAAASGGSSPPIH
jgi:hypothetical protein